MDDRKVLDESPLPIARGYRRFLNASEPRERHDAAYYCFEIYLKYVASIAIAHYLGGERRDHGVNAVLKGLVRPSTGEWLRFLRECIGFLRKDGQPSAAVLAIDGLLGRQESRWSKVLDLYNAVRSFLHEKPSAKSQIHLEGLLGEVVAYRNRVVGHGAPLGSDHYRSFADLLAAAFLEVLERSSFLTALRLVLFDSIQVEGSRVACGAIEFMGGQPVRRAEPHGVPYGSQPPRKGSLHILESGGLPLSLDPLLVAHEEDVYFLNEAGGSPEYLSYSTGKRLRTANVAKAEEELFERILGYGVGESKISTLGKDVGIAEVAAAEPAPGAERRLGGYRIVREVGRGSMGTVFEAFQESLGRRVALKVLPGTFALDPRRLERFHREARATARIHHPSIVPIYEVGESAGTHYYAMEFIEGRSLDRLLADQREERGKRGGGSSASDADRFTGVVERIAGLAEGLEKAHQQGLVHRDVKPSNILVDAGGYVLVDFGLVHEAGGEALTRSGEMVGTLKYMSPEQVSRGKVDARADVYSLGGVLYEALTFEPPFADAGSSSRSPAAGGSDYALQRAILFEEPVPPRRLNSRISRDLETIILHALEKNPERRYASAGALAADLRRFLRGEPIQAVPPTAWTRIARRARRHRRLVGAVLLVTVLLALASVALWRPWAPGAILLVDLRRLTFDAGVTTDPSLSPDGNLMAYASDRDGNEGLDIWVQQLGADPGAVRLTSDPSDEREPAFSPDGRHIAFRSEKDGGGIHVIPAAGGDARLLVRAGRRPLYSPDGKRVLYWVGELGGPARGNVFVIPAQGGDPVQLGSDLGGARHAVWAPGGDHVLFLGFSPEDDRNTPEAGSLDWWVAPVAGGASRRTRAAQLLGQAKIQIGSTQPVGWGFAADDLFLFTRDAAEGDDLWSIEIDPSTFKTRGPPRQLTQGPARCAKPWILGDGTVLFANLSRTLDVWSLPLDGRAGRATGPLVNLTRDDAVEMNPAISADGTKVVFASDKHGYQRVWLKDTETDALKPLTPPEVWAAWAQVWKGETGYLVALKTPSGLDVMDLESGAIIANVTREQLYPECWSPDGTKILCAASGQAFEVEVATGRTTPLLSHPLFDIWEPRYSPEGAWLAFDACPKESRHVQHIYVAAIRSGGAAPENEWIRITEGDSWNDKPRWSPDGGLLYFISERDGFRCIYAQRLDPVTRRPVAGGLLEVQHFHSARLSPLYINLGELKMGVAIDRLVINLAEHKSNIWAARLHHPER